MKKFLISLLFIVFLLNVKSAGAQTKANLFDLSQKPVFSAVVNVANKNVEQNFMIGPSTVFTIYPQTFSQTVYMYVYSADFQTVKQILPKDLVPTINSYYIEFKDTDYKPVLPSQYMGIEYTEKFPNQTIYFYPATMTDLDSFHATQTPGFSKLNAQLPAKDNGFIIAVNTSTQKPVQNDNTPSSPVKNNSYLLSYVFIGSLLAIAVILFYINTRKRGKA